MNTLVIDASVAIKWVLSEAGTPEAVALRSARLLAPDLLIAECANILWKYAQRSVLSREEALTAALAIQAANIELAPMQPLMPTVTEIAMALQHPAYDCFYLALAMREECPFVTADRRFLTVVGQSAYREWVRPLQQNGIKG